MQRTWNVGRIIGSRGGCVFTVYVLVSFVIVGGDIVRNLLILLFSLLLVLMMFFMLLWFW